MASLPVVLSGCLSVPEPPPDLAHRNIEARAQFAAAEQEVAGEVLDGWLASFDDETLHALVHEAWERNPDLYETAAIVDEANARLRAAAGLLYPQVDLVASAQRFDSGAVQSGASPGPVVTDPIDAYSLGLQASWEVDLWGRLRANRLAALEAAQAAGLDYVQARHSLAAAVAEAYYGITAARLQLAIDQQLLEAEMFTAEITSQRVEAGVATVLDEALAEANVDLARAAIEQDRRALAESRRALELLLGRYPAAELEAADDLVVLPAVPEVGVPSELLERRPDILAAEQRVNAAFYNVRQAQAARLPSLALSASGGGLIDPNEVFWSIAANVFGPLFTGGELEAEVTAASAQQRQAIGQYASIALQAFGEVEDALSGERFLAQREAHLLEASDSLRDASTAAENRYEQGLLSIVDLQQVRRQDYQTRAQVVSVRFERVRQRLNLYLALGGAVTPASEAVASTGETLHQNNEPQQVETQELPNVQ